jgi:hypothetical protein
MIENNNTNDVAYLGQFITQSFKKKLLSKTRQSIVKFPTFKIGKKLTTAIFNCNGCRYGFRIKQLKTK